MTNSILRNWKYLTYLYSFLAISGMIFILQTVNIPRKNFDTPLYIAIPILLTIISFCLFSCKIFFVRAFTIFLSFVIACLFGMLTYAQFFYRRINSGLSKTDIDAIMQTTIDESIFYIIEDMYTTLGMLSFIVVTIVIFCHFINIALITWNSKIVVNKFVAITAILCSICLTYSVSQVYAFKFVTDNIADYNNSLIKFKKLQKTLSQNTYQIHNKKQRGEVYVVVIGESQTRDYMHFFAPYPHMENTPWMSSQKNNKNWTFFKNSFSFHTHTEPALSAALTDGRALTGLTFPLGETIISLSHRYGIKTIWLSNQNKMGSWDNIVRAMASTAQTTKFTESNNVFDINFDGELLPFLDEELAKINPDENTLIVLHLQGSHGPYRHRYPQNYTTYDFKDKAFVGALNNHAYKSKLSSYLTASLYTDSILRDIATRIKKLQKPVTFIYFADHGEDAVDNRGHNFSSFTWTMARIPFAVWLSEEYQERYPQKLSHLKENQDKIFTNDLIYDVYAGLLNIDGKNYNSKFDISSPEYSITLDNAIIANKIKITDDYSIKRTYNMLPKNMIVHRSNTIFKTVQAYSQGMREFEIDLVYGKNQDGSENLYVGHEIKTITTSFEQYMELTNSFFDFLWLDIKNINDENKDEIYKIIDSVDAKYNIKHRALIESSTPRQLEKFSKLGWDTTYYLPWQRLLNLEKENKESFAAQINSIANYVKKHSIGGVSYDLKADALIQKYLKPLLPQNAKYYSWNTKWSYTNKDINEKLAPYPHLSRICIPFPSPFHL